MASPMTPSILTLKGQSQDHSNFKTLYLQRSRVTPMLLLNINRKPYRASLMTPSLLTLSDLERSKSRSVRFQSLISRKGAELDPMLLLTINRKPYMASLMTPSLLTLSDLERSKSRSLRFSVVGYLYGIDIFASSNIIRPSGCHKKVFVGGRGFPLSQRSFLFSLSSCPLSGSITISTTTTDKNNGNYNIMISTVRVTISSFTYFMYKNPINVCTVCGKHQS